MKTFEVYLNTGNRIEIPAELFEMDYTQKLVIFYADRKIVAIFMKDNLCGFRVVNEGGRQ